jgi:hypothetical protein
MFNPCRAHAFKINDLQCERAYKKGVLFYTV